jgi:hypothetical protein
MATEPNRDPTLLWRKSRLSGESSGCVEVAKSESSVLVRDSRDQSGGMLEFSPDQWLTFVCRIKDRKTISPELSQRWPRQRLSAAFRRARLWMGGREEGGVPAHTASPCRASPTKS